MNQEIIKSSKVNQGVDDGYIIDLKDILRSLLNQKFKVIFLAISSAIISVVIALQLPIAYKSSALLNPLAAVGSSMNQLGGLASLAGFNVQTKEGDQVALALAIASSQEFFRENLYDDIVLELASSSWDKASNTLLYEEGSLENLPSIQEAHDSFSDLVIITENPLTGMVTIEAEHSSPFVAKQWIDLLVDRINLVMREKEMLEATLALQYFESEKQKTNILSMQKVFSDLMKEQHTKLMLASVKEEFIFETIEPSVVAEKRFKPSRARFCIIFTFFGCMFALFFGYFYDKSLKLLRQFRDF